MIIYHTLFFTLIVLQKIPWAVEVLLLFVNSAQIWVRVTIIDFWSSLEFTAKKIDYEKIVST